MKSTFGTYHPIINFGYFCAVVILGMFLLHPVLLSIAVVAAFSYAVLLNRKGTLKFSLCFLLPMLVVVTLINPLFNHAGVTILGYFRDNPITMESVVYGIVTGFMFVSIILWFSCYNIIMTSDKFIYIFGKVIPAMSLIFSMVLRFVPKFKNQIKVVSKAQKCVGRDVGDGNLFDKARHGLKILSIMLTWALENAIDTADSMRSRGYGLKGRTTFSIYRFDGRDSIVALLLAALVGIVLIGAFMGKCRAQYFPSIEIENSGSMTISVYAAYFLLCFLPIILDIKEELQWRHSQSRI